MTKRRKVLLETTIQIHRLASSIEVRSAINSQLVDKDVYSTSFVLREVLRTIISDLNYVYVSAEKLGADGNGFLALQRLVRLLASGETRFNPRSARREMYVIAAILERFAYTTISLSELLAYLDFVCQKWIRDFQRVPLPKGGDFPIRGEFFLTGLDEKPTELHDWIRTSGIIPLPPPFPSRAALFLEARKESIIAVQNAMRICEARRRDERLLTLLGRLTSDSGEYEFIARLRVNTRGNWCLGDLLIALETPNNVEIYTEDRHFEVIADALQKRLFDGARVKDLLRVVQPEIKKELPKEFL